MTQTHATNFSNNSKNRYNKEQSTPPGFGVFFTVKDQVLGAFSGSHFYSFKFLKCSILEKQTFQSLFISISGSDSLVTHYLVLLSECHNLLKNPHKAKHVGMKKITLLSHTKYHKQPTNNVRLMMLMTWNIHKMFYIKGNNVSYSAGQHHILVSIIFPWAHISISIQNTLIPAVFQLEVCPQNTKQYL